MTPLNANHNPWFMEKWKSHYGCSFNIAENETDCKQYEHLTLPTRNPLLYVGTTIDSINTVVRGMHDLIKDKCPEASENKSVLKNCLEGEELLKYIKNVTFEGTSWTIKFDNLGNMLGEYEFHQHPYSRANVKGAVGCWDKVSSNITVNDTLVDWSAFRDSSDVLFNQYDAPDSVCSYPCGPREYKQQRELACCWDCITCRNNEIINSAADGCEQCPDLYWPDEETATRCEPIEPQYVSTDMSPYLSIDYKNHVIAYVTLQLIHVYILQVSRMGQHHINRAYNSFIVFTLSVC